MPTATRALRRLPAVGAAIAALLALSLATATPAFAHDTLVSTDPAAGSTVENMPAELTLTYSAELLDAGDGTAVEVLSPSGADAAAGEPALAGAVVTVPLAEAAEAGEYTVTWRVVSSDGHPIDGTFSFTVAQPTAPQPTPEPTQSPDESETADTPTPIATTDPSDGTAEDGDSFARNLPWIVGGLLLAAGGGAVVAVLVARSRRGR
ncbi:copper resistance CopC family protein [Microbacterium sp. Marseille-Q6965]|uniref:copper resistance CopC family protein n=1 Tax=Microbacterium sp. Marseille-Q6965 TaxID=2965072 RepID=UPI0021B74D52|nr:copper resistance CopC family protein [Microbacterium sp. Marseille-Q6965]